MINFPVNLKDMMLLNVLSMSKDATAVYDSEELHIRFANDAMISIWGKDKSILGKTLEEAIPELDGQPFVQMIKDVWTTGIAKHGKDTPAQLEVNGELQTFYFDFEYRAITNDEGKTFSVLHTATDVTERVKNAELIRQKEETEKELIAELQLNNEELYSLNEEYTALNEELQASAEEIKAAYDQLREANEQIASSLQQVTLAKAASNLGMFDLDVEKDILIWDNRCKELFGIDPDKDVSYASDFAQGLHHDDRDRVLKAVDNAFNKNLSNGKYDIEYRTVGKKDGLIRWVRAIGLVHFSELDKPIRFIGTVMDITDVVNARIKQKDNERLMLELNEQLAASNEQLTMVNDSLAVANIEIKESAHNLKKMYDDLLDSEQRFRIMAEGTDVMIAIGDETGAATYFNASWELATGRSREDLLKKGWIDLMHTDDKDRVLKIFDDAFANKKAWEWEFRMPDVKGDYKWLLARGTPRFNADKSFGGYISSTIDITERKRDEQRKNDFIGMASHELKTPLTSLSAYMQILQMRAKKASDDETTDLLNKANKQVGKMTKMINGFLNISRFEAGKINIDKQPFDMADLMQEIEEDILASNHTHQIIFAPVESTFVIADQDKIGQVVTNLISNAIKYSPSGTTINVACENIDGNATVSVKDMGIGIATSDISKLFDRYYRVESTALKHISGFGIGLYLCAEIIQRHNGKIWIDSELGEGSTFWFNIPTSNN